ncbi:hypothetical protein L3Q82_004449 [Scortum barcoo]|uniref:Uncharacterized protein n=1 Tax=Scortum barcoo TaxID=214431 RepID=A0ACB8VJP1_9TELE|nr:hypothetical protein L3Q82_004449 [Scortum barcoo]
MDVFGGAPRFLAYPRPVMVQSGTDAVLKCQIGGDPRPAVIWERNNEKIDPQGRYRVFEDGNVYNLIISTVTTEDSGQYICKAKNSIGETYAAATLKVEGEAQEMELREENKPRFLIKPLSTRVGRGEDAVFSCKLWGKPRPEVVWEKDGRKLNEIFESTHFSVGYQDGGWFQLKIFKTRAPDGGVYTCKARNEFGEALAGAVLLVDAGPGHEEEGNRNGYTNGHWKAHQGKQRSGRLVPNRLKDDTMTKSTKVKMFAVTEGKHAKFRCFVTGKPKPEIIWRKDGRLILSGRRYLLYEDREGYFTLKVLYCKQKDNGVYVCAASNTAGQTLSAVHLSVKEPPVRFKQPLIDLEVWERDLAVLECEVPEDSVPITWYLEDRRLQPGAKYGMEEWGTKRRLTIRDIGVDDDGIYLCEMPDGGRSIAEVAVKGTILRKLPRKVDVLEGENAAFCVEVEKEEMDIHWYKDGIELRETHQTILKSFGRTHILVFVNTMPQDSGLVIFLVGRSKTSSQLRVKAAKHCPPSCPVGVQINTERANAALLSWVPAQDSRKNPPSGYVLERQEVGTGSQEWLQCLTTDSATSVEILGDSVPCEADYRFRICSVNKYGKSNNVEFPRAVHLVPVARIQAPLQDALVPEGQDALFSIELSASVIGTWFLSGTQLQEDERYSMRRSRTHQSLRIRGVRDTDNGAEITFIAYGIRDSAALYIQAPLVKFSPLSEMDRNKFVEIGNPIVLYCELSDPAAPVHWYKNGVELQTMEGLHIQSEGTMRRIVIQSAEFSHSGVYCCDAIDDVIRFNVEVEAIPVTYSTIFDVERTKSLEAGKLLELECEVADATVPVCWYKDGVKLFPQNGWDIQSIGTLRRLIIPSAELLHSGLYSCETSDDTIHFTVDIKVPPPTYLLGPDVEKTKSAEAHCPIVQQFEISDPIAKACWYKDGTQIYPKRDAVCESQSSSQSSSLQLHDLTGDGRFGCERSGDAQLNVDMKAEQCHYGDEIGEIADASAQYTVDVKATSPWLSSDQEKKSTEEAYPVEVDFMTSKCNSGIFGGKREDIQTYEEHSRHMPTSQSTYEYMTDWIPTKQQKELSNNQTMNAQSPLNCNSVTPAIMPCDTHHNTKEATESQAPPVRITTLCEAERNKSVEVGEPIVLQCEISDPNAQVTWYKDGIKLREAAGQDMLAEGSIRTLAFQAAMLSHAGIYICKTTDDAVQFHVDIKAPLLKFSALAEADQKKTVMAGCPIALQCELSDPTGQVSWYKDGTQLLPQNGVDIQSEGNLRSLVVPSAERAHTGIYRCESKDDDIQFAVEVKGQSPQIMPVPLSEKYKMIAIGCPIILQCEVSDPVAQVSWFKDDMELFCKTGLDMKRDGSLRKLMIHSAKVSDSGLYSCSLNDDAVTFHVDVEAVPEAERSKSVEADSPIKLQSEISDPTSQACWYEDGIELLPKSGINIDSEGNKRTLIMMSTTSSCSGMYSCKTDDHSDFNDFYVEVKEPPVMIIYPKEDVHLDRHVPEEIILSCELSRHNGVVSWYKDGQKLQESENIKLKTEGPYRRLKILSSGVEDSGEYVCDTADDSIFFHLSITEPPVLIVSPSQSQMELCQQTSERMVLSCEISRPNAVVRWYRDGLQVEENDNLILEVDGVYRRLIIPETTVKDSAEYVCDTADDSMTFFVNIAEPPVRFIRPRKMASKVEKVAGETLVLDCEVSRSNAEVTWKKNGEEVEDSRNITILEDGVIRQLTVHSLTVEDAGQYVCDARDDVMDFHVKVKELPVKILGKTDAKTEKQFLVSDDIILVCELSRSNATVSWYKDNQLIDDTERYCSEEQGVFRSLVVLNAGLEDSGEYTCDAVDDRMVFHITVKEPPVQIIGNSGHPEHHILVEGDDLILQCEVSRPNATVQWLWNGEILKPDTRIKIDSYDVVRKLVLSGLQPSDSGKYICDAINDKLITIVEVQESSVKFMNKKSSNNVSAYENESVTLCAIVSREKANVRWLKDGQLLNGDNIHISSVGNTHKLTINPLQLSDSGEYVCDVNTDEMYFSLLVKEMLVKFIRPLENIVSLKGGSLILRCEINKPKGDVQWLKDGKEISPSRQHTIRAQGRERSFTIHQLVDEDAGEYACESTDDRTSASVTVEKQQVLFTKKMTPVVTEEYSEATLEVEVSLDSGEVQWMRQGVLIHPGAKYTLKSKGRKHSLTIHKLAMSDRGTYSCETLHDRTQAQLTVEQPPVTIFRKLEDQKFPDGAVISIECELSRHNVDVKWLKNGVEVKPSKDLRIYAMGRKRFLQIMKCHVSDSGTYTCDAGDATTCCTVEVYERELLTLQGLEDLDIQEDQNAVFVCEISVEDVPGEWYKNGERIQPTSTIKIRQEGTKHFLLMCNVRPEDSGEIKFVARHVESVAYLEVEELPVNIVKPLQDKTALEKSRVILDCTVSNPRCSIRWYKGCNVILPSERFEICSEGCYRKLIIQQVALDDEGMYSVQVGEYTCSAKLTVEAQSLSMVRELKDVEVVAPDEACFECEVSVPVVKAPVWSLNGEPLQQSSHVLLEKMGPVHRLTLRQTSPDMNGVVEFTSGKAKSRAQLQVLSCTRQVDILTE